MVRGYTETREDRSIAFIMSLERLEFPRIRNGKNTIESYLAAVQLYFEGVKEMQSKKRFARPAKYANGICGQQTQELTTFTPLCLLAANPKRC